MVRVALANNAWTIQAYRNEDAYLKFTLRDSAGNLLNVLSDTFKFSVRDQYDGTLLFQLASPASSGIDLTNGGSGVIIVKIPRAYTAAMNGRYFFDLQRTHAGDIDLPAGAGLLLVLKDITGVGGSAPTVVPPLQFLTYLNLSFDRQLQDGDFLVRDFNLARTGTITVRHAHVDAEIGPSGGSATFNLQDDQVAPTQTVSLIVPSSSGAPVGQEFDADISVPTLTPFVLTPISGKKLSIKIPTANSIERGALRLGFTYA